MPEISIKAEPIFEILHFKITNSLLTAFLVLILFLILGIKYRNESLKKTKSGFFYLITFIVKMIYDLFYSVLRDKTEYFFPLLGSFFVYILLQNWFGLLPGVGSILVGIREHGELLHVPLLRSNNADLNATLVLGLTSVGMTQFYGIKFLGFKQYMKKFINISNPINAYVGILELISEFSKVLSFSFRLFGNIFAGEVLMTIVAFLVPVLATFPFLLLEIFVGLVQALVFSMLTAVFINGAIAKEH